MEAEETRKALFILRLRSPFLAGVSDSLTPTFSGLSLSLITHKFHPQKYIYMRL